MARIIVPTTNAWTRGAACRLVQSGVNRTRIIRSKERWGMSMTQTQIMEAAAASESTSDYPEPVQSLWATVTR